MRLQPVVAAQTSATTLAWDRKEIEGDDGLAVIAKKGKPFLIRIHSAVDQAQIPRDGPLGEDEAEFQQLRVDFRRSPVSILICESPDQKSDLLGTPWPAAARSGTAIARIGGNRRDAKATTVSGSTMPQLNVRMSAPEIREVKTDTVARFPDAACHVV